jgi:Erg28 like protein
MNQVSAVSVANSIQTYSTLKFTQRVYNGSNGSNESPVTPLSSRTFGTWTFLSSIIRLYAALDISNPKLYQLAFVSYSIAFGHFLSEWLVFKTASFGAGLAGPLFVSTGTMIWMLMQWDYYVSV